MCDGCLGACVVLQATMFNTLSGNAMRKVVRGLLALTFMMINVQAGGFKGERKKLPRTLSDTPYPKAQRRRVRLDAEGEGAIPTYVPGRSIALRFLLSEFSPPINPSALYASARNEIGHAIRC